MKRILRALEKIPDYTYPFGEVVEGRFVYFKNAYDTRHRLCVEKWGPDGAQRYCARLIVWREICHFVMAAVFVLVIHIFLLERYVSVALMLSALYILYFAYQEFVYQRRAEHLRQILFKATLDFATWVTPVVLYWLWVFVRAV